MFNLTYAEAMKKREHLIALSETEIYLRDDAGFPWDKVAEVSGGNSYRLSGPSSCYVIALDQGLRFRLNIDFEGRDANGRGVSLFDRDRLREVMRRLPIPARKDFARLLSEEVLPKMAERTAEIRQALNQQTDSEECVRGLIAFADEKQAA